MKKAPLYSRSPRRGAPPVALGPVADESAATPGPVPQPPAGRSAARASRLTAALWAAGGGLLTAVFMLGLLQLSPGQRPITQDDIDAAVRQSLEKEPLPSAAAKAYEAILPSVVRVVGLMDDKDDGEDKPEQRAMERSLGTGVVIIDNGTILTNLHVVTGAKRIRVRFANGHESNATMIGAQPENDLAVLRAETLPDDLEAATMRSTADLRPGDHVIAVGHPFGIGPSVSYGVVSGLKRQFRSPDGDKADEKPLSNLIQFDAAANPGNSGGPLVTMDGQVVGVVTAILNPSEQRTFIGIGFAVPIENAANAAGMPPF
ncbi:MAG: trypsin-like peptidase domain-containing protein [Betaproteobacteria bacterium]|nr:trypsin-like peptidase domain-containing protein [Betaproteobacteria bacterium]